MTSTKPTMTITHAKAEVTAALTGAPPVPTQSGHRKLRPVDGHMLLWLEEGRFTVNMITLYGFWEKADGTVGKRPGESVFLRPLDYADPDTPAWLRDCLTEFLARFNTEVAEAEYGVQFDRKGQVFDVTDSKDAAEAYADRLRATFGHDARVVSRVVGSWNPLTTEED